MRLAEFIRADPNHIERAWEDFARQLAPFAAELDELILRDHLREILTAIIEDMETPQSIEEQKTKSEGHGPKGGLLDRISMVHALARINSGFNLGHAIAEYRALRSSVLFLWVRSGPKGEEISLAEVTRFNETIDQAIAELVRLYAEKDQTFSDRFVAALGHEIRNPLGTIGVTAQTLEKTPLDANQLRMVERVNRNVASIRRMVDDLSIVVRTRMRAGLPLAKENADLVLICEDLLEQIKASHPDAVLKLDKSGNLTGSWDRLRLEQVIFNLVSNAITYSTDKHVQLVLREAGEEAVLTVSNRGNPIPESDQQTIFEPFFHRGATSPADPSRGLGLGLFVVREIVQAHQGSVEVVSNESEGTTFTVRLPRILEG